ncbi:MAG: hypothetical protein MJ185_00075 [Treponema sp.]|nr:hypothetical protein [Treponema sp.]
MKKKILILFAVLLLTVKITAQESETENSKKRRVDFMFKFPTSFYLNTGDKKASAPSPVVFNPGFGCVFPNDYWVSFQPGLSFYYSYYLWYEGRALPAEIENRTATTLSFMLDLPAVFSVPVGSTKLEINAGPSVLMRFGWKANGTSDAEAEDVNAINSYFWAKARYLYFSSGISWQVSLQPGTTFGPFFTFYLPAGSLIAHEGMNGMVLSAGLKITL